jgi:hypothetical protein
MTDKISKTLGIAAMPSLRIVQADAPEIPEHQEKDFEYARGNMINIIEKGNEALDGLLDIAGQSQQPRAYEVVTDLIKVMADANKSLLDLSKQKKELNRMDGVTDNPKTINNNLFVGSTAELQKFLKSQKDGTAEQ